MKKLVVHELGGSLKAMANLLYRLSQSDGIVIPTKDGRIDIDTKNVEKVEIKIYVNKDRTFGGE